jgi:hypothetical protein
MKGYENPGFCPCWKFKSLIFVRIKKIVQKQILRTFSDLYVTCDCSDILLNYPFYLPN